MGKSFGCVGIDIERKNISIPGGGGGGMILSTEHHELGKLKTFYLRSR